jgi:hypothetical protein
VIQKMLFVLVPLFVLCLANSADAGLINGSFEIPNICSGCTTATLVPEASVTGWNTTAADNLIELWSGNFNGGGGPEPAYDGVQHAELNATEVSTLYQDVSGIVASSVVGWQFAHRGRLGLDTMKFTLTDLGINNVPGGGDDTILYTNSFSDTAAAWGFYSGTGLIALGNTVRFEFESISAAGDNQAIGNLLDNADFGVGIAPEPSTALLLTAGLVGFAVKSRRAGAARS